MAALVLKGATGSMGAPGAPGAPGPGLSVVWVLSGPSLSILGLNSPSATWGGLF
jgi:hypothetical protein